MKATLLTVDGTLVLDQKLTAAMLRMEEKLTRKMVKDRSELVEHGIHSQLETCRKAIGNHGGSTGATHRCLGMPMRLDPQPGLHMGV